MHKVHPFLHHGDVFDDYSVLRPLFIVDSVQVYAVLNTRLQRQECLKVLTPRRPLDIASMWEEARRASHTGHPGVVPVYRTGVVKDPSSFVEYPWFTMAYGEYGDLYQLKKHMDMEGWGQEHQRDVLLALLNQVATTIDDLHRLDPAVIHGDIKPGNVVVTGSQENNLRAMVSDFGLNMTEGGPGSMGGTPAYMAPECFEGQRPDTARDRYAYAIMVFEVLSGRRPIDCSSESDSPWSLYNAYAEAQKNAPRLRFSDAYSGPNARGADEVFARALSRNPHERPQSCTEFITEVASILTGKRREQRIKKTILASLAGAVVLVGGTVVALFAQQSPQETIPEGSLRLRGACPSDDVLRDVTSANEASYRFDPVKRLSGPMPQDGTLRTESGCALSVGMDQPVPWIRHSEGWAMYIFNPSGSEDPDAVRTAKHEALKTFFPAQENQYSELSDGTSVRVQTTQDYWDADNQQSTVCAIEDLGHDALAIQVARGVTDITATGDGISKMDRECGQAKKILESWHHLDSVP